MSRVGHPAFARHIVPSPIAPEARLRHDVGEGQGGRDSGTSDVGLPPTPNPSPQGGGESLGHLRRVG
jgi:hypothetical protein